jgi:phosphate transport system substrate-binding protein
MMMTPKSLQKSQATTQRFRPVTCVLFCLLLLLPACAQTPTPTIETVQLVLAADTSTAPLMNELVAAYLVDRPHVAIQLEQAANAERALEALQSGQSHLIALSWLPEPEATAGTVWQLSFARDPIVIITHHTNPVGDVSLLQLRDIFQGQTLFWADLGGPDLDVIPVSREDGAGTRLSFESLVMGRRNVAPTAVVMPSNEAVVEYVASTPGAIGYVSSAWLVPAVNLLAVEGVPPSPAAVENGRYLLARPYYLVARAEPSAGLADWVRWIKEGEGQKVIQRNYALAP